MMLHPTQPTVRGHAGEPTGVTPGGPPGVETFSAPAFPALAALRDRSAERRDRHELARERGYEEGRAEGLRDGRAAVDRQLAEQAVTIDRLARAAAALEAAARDLATRDALALADIESDMVTLAVALATELVGRELAITEHPVFDALRRAATLLPERGEPVVRVNPCDVATVSNHLVTDASNWRRAVDVVADPTVEPGGCIVDVGGCRVDAQIGPAIERLRSVV